MTPAAFARGLRQESAEGRAGFLRALTPAELLELDGGLLGVLLCDTSLQAREVAEARLAERPAARRELRPPPPQGLEEPERRRLCAELCDDAAFVGALLVYPRGRELLTSIALGDHPLDDLLLGLAAESDDPALVRTILALPLDVSGRAVELLDGLSTRLPALREELLGTLVWAALQEAGELAEEERRRARAALVRWAEALLQASEGAPGWEAFLEAGASVTQGPVSEAVPLPGPAARAALVPLARCLHLLLAPAGGLLLRAELDPDLRSSLAELRVVAWRRLLREGLASPEEVAGAAAGERAPGAAVELLRALPGDLSPAARAPLAQLLGHTRASVRAAAARALERSPLLAAMCAAEVDPRAPGAPLGLLRALPPALRDPLLCAWLAVPRPPGAAAEALALLLRPPAPGWEGWPTLLAHADLRVRAAAAGALARLPAAEGPGLHPLLREQLPRDPALLLPLAARFGLPEARVEAARRLLAPGDAGEAEAAAAALALAPADDGAAWAALWEATLRRGVPRAGRRRALEALLLREPPGGSEPPRLPDGAVPAWLGERPWSEAGAVQALVAGRDPEGVRLGARWLLARGVTPGLWPLLEARARELLAVTRRGRVLRLLGLLWARVLRALAGPRGGPWPVRGRSGSARALGALLELELRGGVSTLEAAELEPLLGHPQAELREPARRLYVGLLGPWALPSLLRGADAALAEEALRTGHPDQVEGRLLLGLAVGGAASGEALRHAALRPSPGLAPGLAPLLAERPLRHELLPALRALEHCPGGLTTRRELLRAELLRATGDGSAEALRGAAELVEALEAWELAGALLPSLGAASEAARERLAGLVRAAAERGVALDPEALDALLAHPVESVRELAVSLLRRGGSAGLWARVRPLGPGASPRGAELTGRFLGACEDAWEESMGLAAEGLLAHPSGVVARRALKLLVQQGREVAASALLLRLEDEELRTPALTAISTWAGRFLDPRRALPAEVLEEQRRELRALITALATGPRGQAQAALAGAWEHAVPFARVAALVAVARHALEPERARVADALRGEDPALLRAAALAAGTLAAGADLDELLGRLAGARDAEVRLEARVALLRHASPADPAAVEALLVDAAPEVRLGTLAAAGAREELLPGLALEARLADPDPRLREVALRLLARRPAGEAARLAGVLRDRWPEVRRAALEAVRAWGAAGAVRAEVSELLADPAPTVAAAALALLEAPAPDGEARA